MKAPVVLGLDARECIGAHPVVKTRRFIIHGVPLDSLHIGFHHPSVSRWDVDEVKAQARSEVLLENGHAPALVAAPFLPKRGPAHASSLEILAAGRRRQQ
jgi:hypothetical protein